MSQMLLRPFASLLLALAIMFAGVTPALAAPPTNDDFDFATGISGLPFTDSIDTSEATAAFDDPESCSNHGSVWYAFTPTADMQLDADTFGSNYDTVLTVFTGSRGALNFVTCNDDTFGVQSWVTFNATGGTTYYFMIAFCCGSGGPGIPGSNLAFSLQEHVPQPPVADFGFYPNPASIFDTIQFNDNSYDPENIGIESVTWDFGDGATSTEFHPQHQYSANGDYTVVHTVTTYDGRTAETSQVVQVVTHDVAIVKVTAPKSATVGQTRPITVSIRNTLQPEMVTIELYRSVPGGFEWVATTTQFIPVRSGNRTSQLVFNYTFTLQDAQIGKVNFRAIAYIQNANDALPADNEAVSTPPTTVKR